MALQRAPYTLAEAHGVDEMEKKASARSSQPSSSFPAKKKSGGSFKSKKKSFGSFGNLAGAAGGGKSFQGGGGEEEERFEATQRRRADDADENEDVLVVEVGGGSVSEGRSERCGESVADEELERRPGVEDTANWE